jgi:magnesium transporter
MDGLDKFKRQFEVSATLRKKQSALTGVHLFISLISNLYGAVSSEVDYIESKLAHIEEHIFQHDERRMVREIAVVGKALITFRHILRGHEDVLREAVPLFDKVYKEAFAPDLKNIYGQFFLLQRRINTLFDTHTALRETNIALLSTRQNEIIKNLTIMAFITFPLTLLSSMFGMNVHSAPIIGVPGDFWVIVGIMILASGLFLAFFKHKRWI